MTSAYRRRLLERAPTNDAAFVEYLISDRELPDHLREISRFLDANRSGVVLAPRGHGKTFLALYRAARLIGVTHGRIRIGILAAIDEEAIARSRAIRRLVESSRFAEVFAWARSGVDGSPWRDEAWTVSGADLGKDATCIAMSLGSVRAGPRLDVLLADDAVGLQENATAAGRVKALDTYFSVVDPMVVPGGRRWFIGTRWHEDDIYAGLLARGWPVKLLRAIEAGEPLWPAEFSAEELARRRAEMGTPLFDLQFMNDPSGMGGNVFRREDFQYCDEVPEGVRMVGLDLNASSAETADYTAVVEWVLDREQNLHFVGAWRKQLSGRHREWLTGLRDSVQQGQAPEFVAPDGPRLLVPLAALPAGFAGATGRPDEPRRLDHLYVETTAFQATFFTELLRQTPLPALPVRPDRDKLTRARTLAARYQAHMVFHHRRAPGLREFEDELLGFPKASHDDQVDAAVFGANLAAPYVSSVLPSRSSYSFNRSEREEPEPWDLLAVLGQRRRR